MQDRGIWVSVFTAIDGTIIDPQSEAMAALKAAQAAGVNSLADPQSEAMAALKAAQAGGFKLKVDPQPEALTKLKIV